MVLQDFPTPLLEVLVQETPAIALHKVHAPPANI